MKCGGLIIACTIAAMFGGAVHGAERTVTCLVQLDGKVEYTGKCEFEFAPEFGAGSFSLRTAVGEIVEDTSALNVIVGDPGRATLHLVNSSGAGVNEAGELIRSSTDRSCWLGVPGSDTEGVKVCAK